jgi:hypothetical protein
MSFHLSLPVFGYTTFTNISHIPSLDPLPILATGALGWAEYVSQTREKRVARKVYGGNPEGMKLFGRSRRE